MYVLDTNVFQDLIAVTPHENVEKWLGGTNETDLFVSVVAVMEQQLGIQRKRRWSMPAADAMEAKFNELMSVFSERIVVIDEKAGREWGRLRAIKDKHPMDLAIVASAKMLGFTVVTRNLKDFSGRGVRLLDPFKDPVQVVEAGDAVPAKKKPR